MLCIRKKANSGAAYDTAVRTKNDIQLETDVDRRWHTSTIRSSTVCSLLAPMFSTVLFTYAPTRAISRMASSVNCKSTWREIKKCGNERGGAEGLVRGCKVATCLD